MKQIDSTPPVDTAQDQKFRALALSAKLDELVKTMRPPRFELERVNDVQFGREGDFFQNTENTGPARDREGFYAEINFIEDRPVRTDPRISENECQGIMNAYKIALKGQMPDEAVVSVMTEFSAFDSALVVSYSVRRIQSFWKMKVCCFIPSDCFDEFVNLRA